LDVNVPQLTGREIYVALRKQAKYKNLPIVFITADQGDDVSDLVAKPHTHYMKKAIDINRLIELLKSILG
jgi:CheY-like chemotaxis protein